MDSAKRISELVEAKKQEFIRISDDIWARPEMAYQEFYAVEELIKCLEENGFQIEKNLAGIETAFKATYGTGKPVIGLLAEYDALAGLSQVGCCAEKKPIEEGGNGHGCGHNLLGCGTLAAAVALKDYMEENKVSGTVVFFGCPAEEGGCGKSFMTRDGVFDGLDVALSYHPGPENGIQGGSALANIQAEFSFEGTSAHAAAMPHMGRSALDAAELMNVGVQFLREHVIQEARIHYAFLDVGGTSPNVVQNSARLLYYIRAPKASQCKEMYEWIQDIAKGAALMTHTKAESRVRYAMMDLVANDVLGKTMEECWKKIGPCQYSPEAEEIARAMAKTVNLKEGEDPISRGLPTYTRIDVAMPGSTDVGDVSYVVPTVMFSTTTAVKGTPGHSWQMVSQGNSALAHDGMLYAGKVMARTALEIFQNPELVEKAKAELKEHVGDQKPCLIPPEAKAVP